MDAQKELIAEFDREAANTRKMLDAIPADADFNFKPHPKSMSLGRLVGHLGFCRRVGALDADQGQDRVQPGQQLETFCAREQGRGA